MKIKLLIILTILSNVCMAQVDLRNKDRESKFKDKELAKFKNTETIFILPQNLDEEYCKEILNQYWTVTPFKVVNYNEFNIFNYLQKDYSFVQVKSRKIYRQTNMGTQLMGFTCFLDFSLLENSTKLYDKLYKVETHKRNKKLSKWIDDYVSSFMTINFYLKNEYKQFVYTKSDEELIHSLYTENAFHDLNDGFFKNYIQRINETFIDNINLDLHSGEYTSDLKNLATQKLYIPSYVALKNNAFTRETNEDVKYFNKLFTPYTFEKEVMTVEDICQKIKNNEDFYYLRLVRSDTTFFEVVHSLTGEVVYSYQTNLIRVNLYDQDIKDLDKKIKKAVKKFS